MSSSRPFFEGELTSEGYPIFVSGLKAVSSFTLNKVVVLAFKENFTFMTNNLRSVMGDATLRSTEITVRFANSFLWKQRNFTAPSSAFAICLSEKRPILKWLTHHQRDTTPLLTVAHNSNPDTDDEDDDHDTDAVQVLKLTMANSVSHHPVTIHTNISSDYGLPQVDSSAIHLPISQLDLKYKFIAYSLAYPDKKVESRTSLTMRVASEGREAESLGDASTHCGEGTLTMVERKTTYVEPTMSLTDGRQLVSIADPRELENVPIENGCYTWTTTVPTSSLANAYKCILERLDGPHKTARMIIWDEWLLLTGNLFSSNQHMRDNDLVMMITIPPCTLS